MNNGANAGAVNNGYQGATGIIDFTGFPAAPYTNSFATATVVGNGAISNYNGYSIGLTRQVKALMRQFNLLVQPRVG